MIRETISFTFADVDQQRRFHQRLEGADAVDLTVHNSRDVIIDYTNYRGERSERQVRPIDWHFVSSEWHIEQQWLLRAIDVEKDAVRHFAVKDIHSWRPAPMTTDQSVT